MVNAQNLNKSYKVDGRYIVNYVRRVMKHIKKDAVADISIVFLSDKQIRVLNEKHLGQDHPTDVLSFKIDRREFGSKRFLGEIFVSLDTASRSAGKFGNTFQMEALLYVTHGILHLFGYDDLTAKEAGRMSRKQEEILRCLCRIKGLSKALMPL